MKDTFDLQKPLLWPREVYAFLERNTFFYRERFKHRALGELSDMESRAMGAQCDVLHAELKTILEPFHLIGYHCTRLTGEEITDIRSHGLLPLSPDLIERRIRRLAIPESIRTRLSVENQAAEPNRRGMIWFCLFPPVQDACGVERLFRSWGGESLYNSHEGDPETGPILQGIGIPCVVEMKVPIRTMQHQFFLDSIVEHHFGAEKGSIKAEDWSASRIAVSHILKIHQCPERSFVRLTGWNGYGE